MTPARAIALAGGKQSDLHRVFLKGRYPLSKQAVSLWVISGHMPPKRELQLRRMRPSWFKVRRFRSNGKDKPKASPTA